MGKWLSRDPIMEAGELNLYAFLDNTSINRWDNWGLCDCNTWTEWSNAVGGAFMDGLSDGAAGVADALTGGLSAKFRDAYGINDINDDTNYYTGYYSGNFALESISVAMGTAAGNYVSGAVGAAAARSVEKEAATETVQRWMSRAELEATTETGLLRGGREGTHYATDATNNDPLRARQRLALPQTPEVKATLEVPSNVFSPAPKVDPKFNMPGGGMERTAQGNIPVKILKVDKT